MIKYILFLLLIPIIGASQRNYSISIQTGDLLFQNLDCGPLCDAIEAVTDGYHHQKFSHIGLAYIKNDSTYVIEAIGKDVHLTSLSVFINRTTHKTIVGRLKRKYQHLVPTAIQEALHNIGIAYDDAFIFNNGKYYCSELIYDAFKKANDNQPFFKLEPMTFKSLQDKSFFPVWIDYYKDLHLNIPEGELGINPAGISKSNKIKIIN